MRALESKIPPVVVGLAAALLMWILSRAVPACGFMFPWRESVAAVFAIGGLTVAGLGVLSFRRCATTVNPTKPGSTSSLVMSGVYTISRNPMYLGFLWILVAWAIFLSNALAFLLPPVFALFMNRFQIEPEERALASIFGTEFAAYKSRVRRWL